MTADPFRPALLLDVLILEMPSHDERSKLYE